MAWGNRGRGGGGGYNRGGGGRGGGAPVAPFPCPECGGQQWDNTAAKAAGEMNPGYPDYKCKNCQHPTWLSDTEKNAAAAAANPKPALAGAPEQKAQRPPALLDKAMEMAIDTAFELVDKKLGPYQAAGSEDINERRIMAVQIACSLFDARMQGQRGMFKIERDVLAKKAAEAKEAERKRREAEEAERQRQEQDHGALSGAYPTDAGDDLPF